MKTATWLRCDRVRLTQGAWMCHYEGGITHCILLHGHKLASPLPTATIQLLEES